MNRSLSIGQVVFWRNGKPVDILGKRRIAALRAFYRREPIPDGLTPHADSPPRSPELRWEDVRWETAGDRVTK
jgi:hypothetical protein